MSAAHDDAFRMIRGEHEAVVAALKSAAKSKKRGLPGYPDFDPKRLPAASATADDAYALLLIATAEGFMRDYLRTAGRPLPAAPTLGWLIDACRKEYDRTHSTRKMAREHVAELHNLRMQRNQYAHGHGTSLFPSVADVTVALGRFFHYLP